MCSEYEESRITSDQGFIDLRNKMNQTKFLFKNSGYQNKSSSVSFELYTNFKQLTERLNNLQYLDLLLNNTYKINLNVIKIDEFCNKLLKTIRMQLYNKNNKVNIILRRNTQNQIKTDNVLLRQQICMLVLALHEANFKNIKIEVVNSDYPNSIRMFFSFQFNGLITEEMAYVQEDGIQNSKMKFYSIIESYNDIYTTFDITKNEVQLDIAHQTDQSVDGSYIYDEVTWEFDSKKLGITTNQKKLVDLNSNTPETHQNDISNHDIDPKVSFDQQTIINQSNIDIDVVNHECCGVINVDDEDGILKMHQMLFKRFNKQKYSKINTCNTGDDLKRMLSAHLQCDECKSKKLYVLVDYMMDNEFGNDVVRAAKEQQGHVLDIDFYGLSSNEDQHTENLFLNAGCKKVLGKPLNVKKIRELFSGFEDNHK